MSGDEPISFKQYVDCLKEGQNDYYHPLFVPGIFAHGRVIKYSVCG